jgi:hypothetical protein
MTLPPAETRARRELLRKVFTRLATGASWRRNKLFASTSAQSAQFEWQRQVLRKLVEEGFITRTGPAKSPVYAVLDHDGVQTFADDSNAISTLLQEATKAIKRDDDPAEPVEPAEFDELDDNVDNSTMFDPNNSSDEENGPGLAPEAGQELDEKKLGEYVLHILKLTYMTAEALGDMRGRLQALEQGFDDLNRTVRGALAAKESPLAFAPTGSPNDAKTTMIKLAAPSLPQSRTAPQESPQPSKAPSQLKEAIEFLRANLKAGPVPAAEMVRFAGEAGIAVGLLHKALREIDVVIQRHGMHTHWALPA